MSKLQKKNIYLNTKEKCTMNKNFKDLLDYYFMKNAEGSIYLNGDLTPWMEVYQIFKENECQLYQIIESDEGQTFTLLFDDEGYIEISVMSLDEKEELGLIEQ